LVEGVVLVAGGVFILFRHRLLAESLSKALRDEFPQSFGAQVPPDSLDFICVLIGAVSTVLGLVFLLGSLV